MKPQETVSADALRQTARRILEAGWRSDGYTVPHAGVYPYQWLWDSCFHAIVWAELGEGERAARELARVFLHQDPDGFVPHIDYSAAPDVHAAFWGRRGASTITQPPMYGHAVAELARRGVGLPAEVLERAANGLRFLLGARARDASSGLVTVVHPWESGADDSPRWDHWIGNGPFDGHRWYDLKGRLLETVVRSPVGAPLANPDFGAAPVGFNALVAFNALELACVIGDADLTAAATALVEQIGRRWDAALETWVDAGPAEQTSGRVRVLDALLAVLVLPESAGPVLRGCLDARCYGGRFGPAGVHRDEPAFSPRTYWRGPAWPQITYLLWVAARRAGRADESDRLATGLRAGARRSGFAEYWDPDTGAGLGARPQGWATLAAVVTPSE